jgi:glycosyltransferase involved in cell wall biosynthesis
LETIPEGCNIAVPIRVAVLLPSLQMGGAERLVLEELTYLKDDPHLVMELHLVFDRGSFFDAFAALDIPFRVWGAPHKSLHMLLSYAAIIRHLRFTGCQVLHNHLLDSIGPLVGRLAGARVLATVHLDKRYSWLERFVLARSHYVLGCGEQVTKTIRNFLPSHKIGILRNAVASSPAKPKLSRKALLVRYALPPTCRLLVSLGRLIPAKGYDILIEAFRRVAAEQPDVALLIGGDGAEMQRLQELARASGVSDRIRLPGAISNIHDVLAAAEVYVNSSRVEGLPMTILEAMGHGLPLVATRVGSNFEVVRDGNTGLLVPPDNPKLLAFALLRLLREDVFRQCLGSRARELLQRDYSIEKHCSALKYHYLRLAAEPYQ